MGPLSSGYRGHSVLLITIDSLRADRLGSYGYHRPTPTLDDLAAQSVVFDSMFTTSSTTFPSHVSLLTGRAPADLRNGYTLSDSVTTLAEILSAEGYQTLAFVSALPLDTRFNLDQGFAVYDSDFSRCAGSIQMRERQWYAHEFSVFDCNAAETTERVLEAMQRVESSSPYFLWVHYFDPHFPYHPPPGNFDPARVSRAHFPFFLEPSAADLDSLNELYDGEVRFLDERLGRLFEGLDALGLRDRVITIVVSDHGENLYQHDGYLDHSMVVYETVMQIPAMLQLPGRSGRREDGMVSIVDLMPTVLDLLGLESPRMEGRSLVPLLGGESGARPREFVACETTEYGVEDVDQVVAVRTAHSKVIFNPWKRGGQVFYDIANDPDEKRALPDPEASELAAMERFRGAWRVRAAPLAAATALDEETRAGLKSLGYLRSE